MMLPASFGRPAKLGEVKGPAVVWPIDHRGEAFLVTAGTPPMAFFLSGSHINCVMPVEGSNRWTGLAIEGVEIEFELDSLYSLELSVSTLGSLVRSGTELGIVAKVKDNHGFYDTNVMPLLGNLPEASEGLEVGFCKWRVFIHKNGEKHILRSFDVTPST